MRTIFWMVLAFGIGAGLWHFAQHAMLQSVSARVAAPPPHTFLDSRPVLPTMDKFDAAELRRQLTKPVGPIDTTAGERAGVESAARQADMVRRGAEAAVPLPRH